MNHNKGLPWHIVEKRIHEEIDWLKKVIDVVEEENNLDTALGMGRWAINYYLYRLIAILIVNGQIKAKEINSRNLWGDGDITNIDKTHRHGQEWHVNMMNIIDNYFKKQNYLVSTEPNLYHGRADLGIFMENKKDLYVEVGTTSIYKLCLNLHFMKDNIFLIVPQENRVIEFKT
ncbi:MAG: hypothetical protein Q8O32_03285 [bacterium]|nr:hypothetical protein [bacterium]